MMKLQLMKKNTYLFLLLFLSHATLIQSLFLPDIYFDDKSSEDVFYDCFDFDVYGELDSDNFPEQPSFIDLNTVHGIVAWIVGDDENAYNPLSEFYENIISNPKVQNAIVTAHNDKDKLVSDLKEGALIFAQFTNNTSYTLIYYLTAAHKTKEHLRVNRDNIDNFAQQIVPGTQLITKAQPILQKLDTIIDFCANGLFISLLCVKNGSDYWLEQPTNWQEPTVPNINKMIKAAVNCIKSEDTLFIINVAQNVKKNLSNPSERPQKAIPLALRVADGFNKIENNATKAKETLYKFQEAINDPRLQVWFAFHLSGAYCLEKTKKIKPVHDTLNIIVDALDTAITDIEPKTTEKQKHKNKPRFTTLSTLVLTYVNNLTIIKILTKFFEKIIKQ